MKRFLVFETTDEVLARLADGKRIPGTIGWADDGETVDFHPHFRSNAPRPKRRRIDITCAKGMLTIYLPDGQLTEPDKKQELFSSAFDGLAFLLAALFNLKNKGGANAHN